MAHKEVWFKTDLCCCRKCPGRLNKYLNKKKKNGEMDRFYTNMDDSIFVEGDFDATELARKLSKKLCNQVRIDSVEKHDESRREEEMADETSICHQWPLQDETGRRRYNASYEIDATSIYHQRPLQEENSLRRYGSINIPNIIGAQDDENVTYYGDFGGSYK